MTNDECERTHTNAKSQADKPHANNSSDGQVREVANDVKTPNGKSQAAIG
ncbi:Hypothetical protein (plasmid) [Pseudomonas putida]|nr:Hypothetical protein [Pseudomonas putida]